MALLASEFDKVRNSVVSISHFSQLLDVRVAESIVSVGSCAVGLFGRSGPWLRRWPVLRS